ncbi:MAG: hypothetical protein JEZ11_13020 [Desulfobacterales bacterium]|nr:hypothetical protein [Desulfobacterales bacterium]
MTGRKILEQALNTIAGRALDQGGFAARDNGGFRADATAWAVMALAAAGRHAELIEPARRALATWQMPDGRVPLSRDLAETFWPTALAMLAWHGAADFDAPLKRAGRFLIEVPVLTVSDSGDRRHGPDTSLRGWPWVSGTYSWVVPTAAALLALESSGMDGGERVVEARDLIVNRQLPSGGWNYGDTFKFGTELRPFPENTGWALNALAGHVAEADVAVSLDYLQDEASRIRTPLALSWAVLGLGTWSRRPARSEDWLLESLGLQNRYGVYDTEVLAHVVVAFYGSGGLLSALRSKGA